MEQPANTIDAHCAQQQNKKRKIIEKVLPSKVKELVPESQAYMEMLAFERKLDFTITRKRTEIQEALKRPIKQKRRLRIFITNIFFTNEQAVPSWELRIEGRLADETSRPPKRKFSSFFKSLVIELDSELYGPDNHLVEWHRSASTSNETDGFQVKRPGDRPVKCTILMQLEHQASQFKLDARLARLLGKQVGTRPAVVNALWQYIKNHKLQDAREREYINCDQYFQQIFECQRMKFAEIPNKIVKLLAPPDPIKIEHLIQSNQEPQRAIFEIDVEVDDSIKTQMNNFLLSTSNVEEIQSLDDKIYEILESINQTKTSLEFFSSFSQDPLRFINKWIASQAQDLKLMTDQVGGTEEERRAEFYYQPWMQEAVFRYFYRKVEQRRAELQLALTSKK